MSIQKLDNSYFLKYQNIVMLQTLIPTFIICTYDLYVVNK
jgi:hypothetical protein